MQLVYDALKVACKLPKYIWKFTIYLKKTLVRQGVVKEKACAERVRLKDNQHLPSRWEMASKISGYAILDANVIE